MGLDIIENYTKTETEKEICKQIMDATKTKMYQILADKLNILFPIGVENLLKKKTWDMQECLRVAESLGIQIKVSIE